MSLKRNDYTYNKQHNFRNSEPEVRRYCIDCHLPIFLTPYTKSTNDDGYMGSTHDTCVDPPDTLAPPLLHPGGSLVINRKRHRWRRDAPMCSRCGWECGDTLYECPDVDGCGFRLDSVCALSVKVMHRSHEHRLMAVRGSFSSSWCSACGSQHGGGRAVGSLHWDQFYVCAECDFWLHPDCAELPNAVKGGGALQASTYVALCKGVFQCNICSDIEEKKDEFNGFGFYVCFNCDYYTHVKCAKAKSPHGLRKEYIFDGVIPNSIRLPMKDDHVSVMPLLMEALDITNDSRSTSTSTGSDVGGHTIDLATTGYDHERVVVDEHVLILHDGYHYDTYVERVCNACVQPISPSNSFYSCVDHNETSSENGSPCKDFFLHNCCAYLPAALNFPRKRHKTLTLLTCKADGEKKTPFNLFKCDGCQYTCNGFAYLSQTDDGTSLVMDVVCAIMPTSIMHRSHGVLELKPDTSYACNNCRNFGIHLACALIPEQVIYSKFDAHPLFHWCNLEKEQSILCEVCENSIPSDEWHYNCYKCQQSLHFNCTPFVDRLSKIKFGFTIRVRGHSCSVACVRVLSIYCYPCGHCGKTIKEHKDEIAFECPKCYFRIHKECCVETLLSDKVEWKGVE
ncbi:cysteine/Histidine-rich C1 domain family protein [Striga asiatica]|uniref:Cysteine/Histidine-rich C1 domain family protein n=1 Tax=Striga asiatica TaxID=4170 RepID=A0A5A7Q1P3_STRAF|nr:cysteine/Histidine-rich C1 domain family protein [Striga asiatica]